MSEEEHEQQYLVTLEYPSLPASLPACGGEHGWKA
jgi:hypothetical protein